MKYSIVLLVVIALGAGFFFFMEEINAPTEAVEQNQNQENENLPTTQNNDQENNNEENQQQNEDQDNSSLDLVVTYTNSGYSPNELRIQQGDTVTFRNESSREMWTASAIHPTHTVYPGSNIGLCNTAQELGVFDACGGIASGGEWSFTFTETGSWGYHNHLIASHTGRIVVEE